MKHVFQVIFFYVLRVRDAKALAAAEPTAVDDEYIVPIDHCS